MIRYVAAFEFWGFVKVRVEKWDEETMLGGVVCDFLSSSTMLSVGGDLRKEGLSRRCTCYDLVVDLQVIYYKSVQIYRSLSSSYDNLRVRPSRF